jgi:acyl-CoA reductase-like NAD-dependent aldehyde dehydrogenase
MSPSKVSTIDFEKFYNIVDGNQRGSKDIHHGINPTTGEELWDVPIATEQDLNDAVASAKKAFPAWRATPIEKRKELLMKFADLFNGHAEEFTTLLCKESGKPRKFAAMEVGAVAGFVGYHCELHMNPVNKDTSVYR